jgi:hypothetical protein
MSHPYKCVSCSFFKKHGYYKHIGSCDLKFPPYFQYLLHKEDKCFDDKIVRVDDTCSFGNWNY